MPQTHAVVLASGSGSRFGGARPKQLLEIAGRSLLAHAVRVFDEHPEIDRIHLVVPPASPAVSAGDLSVDGLSTPLRIVRGGATRRESSWHGVRELPGSDRVLVHDAARPCVTAAIVTRCLEALERVEAVTASIPASDTVLRVDGDDRIAEVPSRESMRLAQTPQGFRVDLLQRAHRRFERDPDPPRVTDDCGLVLHYGLASVLTVAGSPDNLKVTLPPDLARAEEILLGAGPRSE